jgi:hypothetical protein
MSDRSSLRLRWARGLALLLSVGLGSLVVVNAQFGCDSPASNPPPPKEAAPNKPEPETQQQPEPPQKPDSEARAEAEPTANESPRAIADVELDAAAPPSNNAAEPVFMPASKSGGDFGAVHFPGEQSATQQQQLQQNPAPEQ